MIYSFQAFQRLGVFCDKKEVLQFKIKAVKDPKESGKFRERWPREWDTLKMDYLIL